MPSSSKKQERFMAACAHGWKPTKGGRKCPPKKVSKEYTMADQLRRRGKSYA